MSPTFHLRTCTIVLLVVLTACSPAATPTATEPPAPTTAPTTAPPTATLAPTNTPKPSQQPIKGKFDVGGYSLYVECDGVGGPTTVLEPGRISNTPDAGGYISLWFMLEPHTRVCMYDRAGSGQSDSAHVSDRSSAQWVEDLRKLLSVAGEPGPYVLVGYDMGGFNVLVYADKYPQEVAGVVLIDSEYPYAGESLVKVLPTPASSEEQHITTLRQQLTQAPSLIDWDYLASAAEVSAINSLGSLPLVVITTNPTMAASSELGLKLEQVWLELQKKFTTLSSNSELIIAPTGIHPIHQAQPQLVADTILKIVKAARSK